MESFAIFISIVSVLGVFYCAWKVKKENSFPKRPVYTPNNLSATYEYIPATKTHTKKDIYSDFFVEEVDILETSEEIITVVTKRKQFNSKFILSSNKFSH